MTGHFVCFGVTERFANSLHLMAHFLGWRVPYYERLNVAASRPERVEKGRLGASLLMRVRAANAWDLRLYEYAAESFRNVLAETCPVWVRARGRLAHWAEWARRLPGRVMPLRPPRR